MTFEAEYLDAEYLDAEYAKYTHAAGPAKKRVDWMLWTVLALLALVIYTAAFFALHRSSPAVTATPNLDLHDCTLPEVKVDLLHPSGTAHDVAVPYAHSSCREGDVRLWESTH